MIFASKRTAGQPRGTRLRSKVIALLLSLTALWGFAAFVTLREGYKYEAKLRDELRQFVADKIGAIARPDDILFSADLPKTRSGKNMRRLLRDIAEGRALGDTTTLADPNVVNSLKEMYENQEG